MLNRASSVLPIGIGLLGAALAFLALLPPVAGALPADRAYEMVSPPFKNNGDMGAGTTAAGYRSSPDGNRLAYLSTSGFGDVQGHTIATGYQATRGGSSWASTPTSLPMAPLTSITYMGPLRVSGDLSRTVVQTNMNLETGQELPAGVPYAWYLVDPYSGERQRITPPAPDGSDYELDKSGGYELIDGSNDFSQVYFTARAKLTADAPAATTFSTYRYADGDLQLVSTLPNGTAVSGVLAGAPFLPVGSGLTSRLYQSRNSVSRNGNVVFWNRQGQVPPPQLFTKDELYRTVYSETGTPSVVLVNASENSLESVAVGPANFMGASDNGSIAYFESDQRLVDEDTDSDSDLYQWDASKPAGSRLTLVSAGDSGTAGAVARLAFGVSDDGKRIYFQHRGKLTSDAPADLRNKLYAWDDGELHFITAREVISNPGNFTDGFAYNATAISPSGNYFAFVMSANGATPDNLNPRAQVFVYDLENEQLSCASCVGTGTGNAQVAQLWQGSLSMASLYPGDRRNITDDGTVFFDTVESLLPNQDTNGKRDVYMWKGDQLDLISSGRGASDSFFVDASEGGESAFFYTYDRLVGWDVDHNSDLYAARVGGGLAEPKPDLSCNGSGCQNPPTASPLPPSIGSVDFGGDGNVGAAPQPERASVRISRLKAVRGAVARLRVRVPAAGRVVVSGPRVRRAGRSAGRAGVVNVRVALKPGARAALRKKKRVKVAVRVTYRARSGQSAAKTVRVAFNQPKPASRKVKKGGR